jgi:hypothetical protein
MSQVPNSFEQQVEELNDDFLRGEVPGESQDDVGSALLDYVLKRERLRHGVDDNSPAAVQLDVKTLQRMATWDSDNPGLLVAEKALRRLASEQRAEAVKLLEAAINARIQAISDAQRRKAQAPRRKNSVDRLIEEIVTRQPEISENELFRALRAQIGRGLITDIDGDVIVPADENSKSIKVGGLGTRLSRIRKKITKAG